MPTMLQKSAADFLVSCSADMEISPVLQAKLLFYSFCLGGSVGVICDVFRPLCAFLKKKGHGYGAVRFIGDLLALVYAALGTVLLTYYFNKGEFRGFCLLGLAVGFFVYRHTLSYAVSTILIRAVRLILHIFRVFVTPFVKMFEILVNIFVKINYYIHKALEKITVLVYNMYVKSVIVRRACKGFLTYRRNK